MKLGEFVYNYRTKKNLSMEAFGNLCGLSRAYISLLELGINPTTRKEFSPTMETLKKIALVTHMSLDDLSRILDLENIKKNQSLPKRKAEEFPLTKEEKRIIENYRCLTSKGKTTLRTILHSLLMNVKSLMQP